VVALLAVCAALSTLLAGWLLQFVQPPTWLMRCVLPLAGVAILLAVTTAILQGPNQADLDRGPHRPISPDAAFDGEPPRHCQAVRQPEKDPLSVDLFIRKGGCWGKHVAPVSPGEVVELMLVYRNGSDGTQEDVAMGVNLAPLSSIIDRSGRLANGSHPEGASFDASALGRGGVEIGSYLPGANAYARFALGIDSARGFECGDTELKTVGVVRTAASDEYFNVAVVHVQLLC